MSCGIGDRLRSLKNALDFPLRRLLGISLRRYREKPEDKDDLFAGWPDGIRRRAQRRDAELAARYRLVETRKQISRRSWLEILHVLDGLDRVKFPCLPARSLPGPRRVLDIGSRSFAYAAALYHYFLVHDGYPPDLLGIELDAYRRLRDLSTRYDQACFHIAGLPGTRYQAMDLLDLQGQFDTISWFFPFLTPRPLLAWGLPLSCLRPRELLVHARTLLAPGAALLVVNQSAAEGRIQQSLFRQLQWPVEAMPLWSPAFPRQNREWRAWLACRATEDEFSRAGSAGNPSPGHGG